MGVASDYQTTYCILQSYAFVLKKKCVKLYVQFILEELYKMKYPLLRSQPNRLLGECWIVKTVAGHCGFCFSCPLKGGYI